jgi:D-alanyl-D-alanine carboxypeptidase
VYGHTGNFPGYTQFVASSSSGRRSVTVSINKRLQLHDGRPFEAARHAELRAVCAALR